MKSNMSCVNADHFKKLMNSGRQAEWHGVAPQTWAKSVPFPSTVVEQLAPHIQSRSELRQFVMTHPDPAVRFAAVMAWGGMRRANARASLRSAKVWRRLIEEIAQPGLSRKEAFEVFIAHRKTRNSADFLQGIGVAYFTKLLFFIRPKQDAYILDQWTGKSINLLFGRGKENDHIIKMDGNFVSDRNAPENYECFCMCVEHVADLLQTSPQAAEEKLFSSGGTTGKIGDWRAHVKMHWELST
jgi:hypothetical protein